MRNCVTAVNKIRGIGFKRSALANSCIIGIDEVGRGAIAGPVVVAAILMPAKTKIPSVFGGVQLKDSKKLTVRGRKLWFEWMRRQASENFLISVESRVYPGVIDKKNISQSANLAAWRAFEKSVRQLPYFVKNKELKITVYLDGGLYIRDLNYQQAINKSKEEEIVLLKKNQPKTILKTKTIIGGDKKIKIIKLASIFAKVKRDCYMTKQGRRYPNCNFGQHKGYGTSEHFKAIKKYGLKKIHRLTFIRKKHKIKIA